TPINRTWYEWLVWPKGLTMKGIPTNADIAGVLEEIAEGLETQDSNPFRVRAYHEGAHTIRDHRQSVADLVHQGKSEELTALPNIGEGIASVIQEYVTSGKSQLMESLKAKTGPEDTFGDIPGIGPALASKIVHDLHIQTLEELEEAAHDGRLE